MELILVLINEGYKDVAENEFKQEYQYIDQLIEEYNAKKKTPSEVRTCIDEYCL